MRDSAPNMIVASSWVLLDKQNLAKLCKVNQNQDVFIEVYCTILQIESLQELLCSAT